MAYGNINSVGRMLNALINSIKKDRKSAEANSAGNWLKESRNQGTRKL